MRSAIGKPMWLYWWRVIKRFWWLFGLLAIAGVATGYLMAKQAPASYRAETWLEANPRARIDSEIIRETNHLQTGTTAVPLLQRPNVPEVTLGFFLRSEEMRREMRQIIIRQIPDVLERYKQQLLTLAPTASEGLDYWIRQNLTIERNGKDQFYRLKWLFFSRDAAKKQLTSFISRAETLWQRRLTVTLKQRLEAIDHYRQMRIELPQAAMVELEGLRLDYQTVLQLLDGGYLNALMRLSPVDVTPGPVYPQLIKVVIIGLLPFIVLAGLLLKILAYREQKCA